jgi:hypothetical protein
VVPNLFVAVLSKRSLDIGIVFAWGGTSFLIVSVLASIALYYGELLALDWRKALTRQVWG